MINLKKWLTGCEGECIITESESKGTNTLSQPIYFNDLSSKAQDKLISRLEKAGADVNAVLQKEFPIDFKIYFDVNINEATEQEIQQAKELVGGEVVDGKGLQFTTKEEVNNAKQLLLGKGIKAYSGNRNPLVLFLGDPLGGNKGGKYYGQGPFAAEIIKAISNNPSAKKQLDKLVTDKGESIQDEYTGVFLEDTFSRQELKKYSKILASVPNEDKGEKEVDAMGSDIKLQEFRGMFPDFDNPVDLIIGKFKEDENVCPYVRTFMKRGWITDKKEILSVANATKVPNIQELEHQLSNC